MSSRTQWNFRYWSPNFLTFGFETPSWKAQHAPSFQTGGTFVSIYSIAVGIQSFVGLITKIHTYVCKKKRKKCFEDTTQLQLFLTMTPIQDSFHIILTSVILQNIQLFSFLSSSCRNCAFSRSPPYAPKILPKTKSQNRQMNEHNNHFKKSETNQSWINRTGKQSHTEWEATGLGSRHLKETASSAWNLKKVDVPAVFKKKNHQKKQSHTRFFNAAAARSTICENRPGGNRVKRKVWGKCRPCWWK